MDSRTRILEILEEYCHRRKDREIMAVYLTDHPGSLERIAEECDVDVSTVKRAIKPSRTWVHTCRTSICATRTIRVCIS